MVVDIVFKCVLYLIECEAACVNDCRIDENKSRNQNVSFVSGWENNIIPFIALVAITDIKKGEEILGSYGKEYWDKINDSSDIFKLRMYEEQKKRDEDKRKEIDMQRSKKLQHDREIQKLNEELAKHNQANNYLKQKCEQTGSKDKSIHLEIKAIRLLEGDEVYIECPYLSGHTIQKKEIKAHLLRCPDRFNSSIKYDVCPFSNDHIMDVKEMQEHIKMCRNNPDNIQSCKRVKFDIKIENNSNDNDNYSIEEKNDDLKIPPVLRNLSPSVPMVNIQKSSNSIPEEEEEEIDIHMIETSNEAEKADIMINTMYSYIIGWEIILNKIENDNGKELQTNYQSIRNNYM